MKKLFLLLILFCFTITQQAQTFVIDKPLKIKGLTEGIATDSLLTINPQGYVSYFSKSLLQTKGNFVTLDTPQFIDAMKHFRGSTDYDHALYVTAVAGSPGGLHIINNSNVGAGILSTSSTGGGFVAMVGNEMPGYRAVSFDNSLTSPLWQGGLSTDFTHDYNDPATPTSEILADGTFIGTGLKHKDGIGTRLWADDGTRIKINDMLAKPAATNLQAAISSCLHKENNNFGVLLFGDSMYNYPSSWIMSSINSLLIEGGGLGNSYYPSKTDYINNSGSFMKLMSGAQALDVNQQKTTLGSPEWIGSMGYLTASPQNIEFIKNGLFPVGVKTKIYVLTGPTDTGTYDIERTTNKGITWTVVVTNATTNNTEKSMKVHEFDDTALTYEVGYRIVWKSGVVMCLDPLFTKPNGIYHISGATGGADFKLQCQVPKERVRFLIDNANIRMVTSSHRYEIANINELNAGLDKMDTWFEGKNLDVLYFGQPPQLNDNATTDQFKQDTNEALYKRTQIKQYMFYNMYLAFGGLAKAQQQWAGADPIHLSQEAYASIAPEVLNYVGLPTNVTTPNAFDDLVAKRLYIDWGKKASKPNLETDLYNLDLFVRSKRFLKFYAGDKTYPVAVMDAQNNSTKNLSVGDRLTFAFDGNGAVPSAADPTAPALYRLSDINGTGVRVLSIYSSNNSYGRMEGLTVPALPKSFINVESGFVRTGTIPTSSTDPGIAGQIELSNTYIYVCVSSGNWIRFLKDSW